MHRWPSYGVNTAREEDKEGEMLSWEAVTIGYALGLLFGVAIYQVIASHTQVFIQAGVARQNNWPILSQKSLELFWLFLHDLLSV